MVCSDVYYVVDMDLSKFFDRVNHDRLMSRVATRIKDKRVLKLIRKYLRSGVMVEGTAIYTEEGTPQGGPLSPLLSNIVLDELNKELERRGHKFVRYADDFMIYCKIRKAAERVKRSITRFLTMTLKLKVNEDKSAVSRPWLRKFLGFTYFQMCGQSKIRIHAKTMKRLKDKVRELTRRSRGKSLRQQRIVFTRELIFLISRIALVRDPYAGTSLRGHWQVRSTTDPRR